MYYALVFLSIAACVGTVYSAVAIQLPVEKPADLVEQDGCYITSLKRVLPYNKPFSPQDGNYCRQYTCRKDNTTMIFSCGSIAVGDGCELIPGDKYLPYPECCDKPTCNLINHKLNTT